MGLDPSLSAFPAGSPCLASIPVFGPGDPPINILVTTDGLGLCGHPGSSLPPNSAIITQTGPGNPCQWFGTKGGWFWNMRFGVAQVLLIGPIGPPPRLVFSGGNFSDNFPNLLICSPDPAIWASGGDAILSWGPDI